MKEKKPGPKPPKYVFGYVDETGLLQTPIEDRIFGLGLLKLEHPNVLHRKIIDFTNTRGYRSELKFSEVRDDNLSVYKDFIDLFFTTPNSYFSCLIFDKSGLDFGRFFKNNYNHAYNIFAGKLISDSLDASEYIVVLADDVNTPKKDNYERDVREKVKRSARRNALVGICRLDSRAVNEIQMVDVLLGAVSYAFKVKLGLVKINKRKRSPKFKLMQYIQKHLYIEELASNQELKLKYGVKFKIRLFDPVKLKKLDSALGTTAS